MPLRTNHATAARNLPPCAELSTGDVVRQALWCQALGVVLLTCHVVLCKLSIIPFFPATLLVLGFVYYRAPLAGLLMFFQWLIYENWVI